MLSGGSRAPRAPRPAPPVRRAPDGGSGRPARAAPGTAGYQTDVTTSRPRERRNVSLNRRARFEFELSENVEAGLVLLGSEVKSLRRGGASLEDAYVGFDGAGRPALLNCRIAPYEQANRQNHEPLRPRQLLLSKVEIRRLRQRTREQGLTIVPLQLFFEGPWCKVEIAVGRGKQLHDKRQSLRERQDKRETDRMIRGR
jgi:SsrA-binding protein